MQALMTFVETHPWWTLVYLIVIFSGMPSIVKIVRRG